MGYLKLKSLPRLASCTAQDLQHMDHCLFVGWTSQGVPNLPCLATQPSLQAQRCHAFFSCSASGDVKTEWLNNLSSSLGFLLAQVQFPNLGQRDCQNAKSTETHGRHCPARGPFQSAELRQQHAINMRQCHRHLFAFKSQSEESIIQ